MKKNIVLLALMALTSCHASHVLPPAAPVAKAEARLPQKDLSLPVANLKLLFPVAGELAEAPTPRKEITESFSTAETNEVAVRDPKRFLDGDTEIIDLSLITKDQYAFPLKGGKVISPYAGRRRHHTGADIKTCPNDTIVAAFDGVVRLSRPYAAYGNVIVIRHYNGLETVYSHNSRNFVKPGDRVKAGDPIGLTGRTGRATTEHLHFEVRFNGQHFNPNLVFNLRQGRLHHKYLVCTKRGNSVDVRAVNVLPHQRMGSYNPFQEQLSDNPQTTTSDDKL